MDDTTRDVIKATLYGFIRHGLTLLAGALVAKGLLQAGDTANFIQIGGGIVLGLVGMAWSWWQKVGQAKVEKALKRAATIK